MASTLTAPPSHQIRISPEKSEFDAKGAPSWCMLGRAANRRMMTRVRRVDFVAGDGCEGESAIRSSRPFVSVAHLALQGITRKVHTL